MGGTDLKSQLLIILEDTHVCIENSVWSSLAHTLHIVLKQKSACCACQGLRQTLEFFTLLCNFIQMTLQLFSLTRLEERAQPDLLVSAITWQLQQQLQLYLLPVPTKLLNSCTQSINLMSSQAILCCCFRTEMLDAICLTFVEWMILDNLPVITLLSR